MRKSGRAKAERLIEEALRCEGVSAEQMARWRKGHPYKIKLAVKLRKETTVTVGWIAERFAIGSRGHLVHLLHRNGKGAAPGNEHQRTLGI